MKDFFDGYCLDAYNYFGAHFENDGVIFRVYAPNAKSVRLIGQFNNWDNNANYLINIGNGIWEAFIKGLQEYAAYKYVIETNTGKLVEKNDPFAFYNELRPDWTNKVVSLEYPWSDADWISKRDNNMHKPMSIYEVHFSGFKHHGAGRWFNYDEMIDELIPYVKQMGYTHIELMPLNEYPFDGSWGYQQFGYFSVTSRYGSVRQLMHFIDACHNNGIGVIMDIVPAHFVKDDYGLIKFDGTPLFESRYKKKAESQWDTIYFDFDKPFVNSFLLSSASLWLDKYHIDGLRVDAVSNLIYFHGNKDLGENKSSIDFIKRFNYHLHEKFKGIMTIAEDSTDYSKVTVSTLDNGLGFDYKWDLGWMNDTLKYYQMDPEYRKYHHNMINFSMAYFYSEKFLLPFSHDEVVHMKGSIINKMWGSYEDKFAQCRNLMTYMFLHPGKKLNFMGNELATFSEFSEEKELDWNLLSYPTHDSFKRMVRDLNLIYDNNPTLYLDEYNWENFKWIDADNASQRIYSFIRIGKESDIVVVLNMAPISYEEFRIGVKQKGTYTEIFNSEKDIYSGCNMCNFNPINSQRKKSHNYINSIAIRLAPYAAVVLEVKK